MKSKTTFKLKKSVIINFINPDLAYCLNLEQPETDVLKVEGVSCRFLTAIQKGHHFNDLFENLSSEYNMDLSMKDRVRQDFESFTESLKKLNFI